MNDYARMKEATKWMWALGDYGEVARHLEPHAQALVAACGIEPGMAVLDVAAGNGNFSLAAARGGAAVTASDLTPKMIELGRARAAEERLPIEWVEADAEELPFAANRFDAVASVFGAMFAPRPERVAAELFRVAKPGGVVAMTNYSDVGFLARLSALLGQFSSAPPGLNLPSPFAWGDPDVLRSRFGGLASSIELEPRTVSFVFASPDEGWEFWERTNPPLMALNRMLPPERYQEVVEQGRRLVREANAASDGRLVLDSGYLQVVARKASSQRPCPCVARWSAMNAWFDEFAKRCAEIAAQHGAAIDAPRLEADLAGEVLDLTRVVAHTSERQFAPLAAFIAGRSVERMASAQPGLSRDDVRAFLADLKQSLDDGRESGDSKSDR